METNSTLFCNALENNDYSSLKLVPKADLHSHSTLGGSYDCLCERLNKRLPNPISVSDLASLEGYMGSVMKPILGTILGFRHALACSFVNAQLDTIKILEMSTNLGHIKKFRDVGLLIQELTDIHQTYAPNVLYRPEIGIRREHGFKKNYERLLPWLETGFFKSIDMSGDETYGNIKDYKVLFRAAQKHGLKLKAHVGEFGTAESVRLAVEELELDEVQHGIAAAQDESVMKWLSDNEIQLNVTPTSNVRLSAVSSLKDHPIRILYDMGVVVTINSDDAFLFDTDVSKEFLSLFNAGLFTAKELNVIRLNGLNNYRYG